MAEEEKRCEAFRKLLRNSNSENISDESKFNFCTTHHRPSRLELITRSAPRTYTWDSTLVRSQLERSFESIKVPTLNNFASRSMSNPSLPYIPHRHSIDNPHTYLSSPPPPSFSSSAPPLSNHSSPASRYSTEGRRSSDTSYGIKDRQPSSSSSRDRPTPIPTRSDSSTSGLSFTRKLLKKNRNNSSTSAHSPLTASPDPSPNLANSTSPLPPLSIYPSSPHSMKPYPYSPTNGRPSYPSPYPSYHAPPHPPNGANSPPPVHRSSMSSLSHASRIEESEEEQLRRIQQESLEYEQQRQMDLEAEEARRLQQALDESAALAEQEWIRTEERERLRRLEEEIAVREALVYSREFEQAEAERIAREQRKRTLEEEKEVQRVLARSRTVNRGRENSQERRENEAFEAATRLSLEDDGRWERGTYETGTPDESYQNWQESTSTHRELPLENTSSSQQNLAPSSSYQLPQDSRQIPSLTPQSSFVVANPDRSASSVGESDDDEAPPPSYTLVADDSAELDTNLRPEQSDPSSLHLPTNQSPLPPTGAAPSRYPTHISTGYAPYDIEAETAEANRNLQDLERSSSILASVGSYQPPPASSPSLFESIPFQDSISDDRMEQHDEENAENPFDDQFEEGYEEEATEDPTQQHETFPPPDVTVSPATHLSQPPIVVATAPSQSSNSNPASPQSNHRVLPSPAIDHLSTAPSPIRRVSEPPPSIPTLLPSPAAPSPTSHSANNTPEPSPSLDAYPNAPSFGGIVEDPSSSSHATAEYVLDGVRWGFVSIERAALHPPLDSKGAFPRGAQLSSSTNDEGKQAFLSFGIEAKSWNSLLVFMTWFGKSRLEASPHDHGVDENSQGHQVSVRIEFFRSFLDSTCRVRCRLELLPLAQSRPMSSDTTSPNSSTPETTPSFDNDCPNVHIILSHRPQLPLNLANLASLLANALAHSRHQRQMKASSSSARQQSCLSEAVDFLQRLNGERKEDYDDGNDSDDVGWTNKLKSRLRKKKVRVIKTDTLQSADRHSVLPEGAMLITPFSADD